jgi:hypothetical protein
MRLRWREIEHSYEGREMHVNFWLENRKERDHLEDLGIDGMIILESILEK